MPLTQYQKEVISEMILIPLLETIHDGYRDETKLHNIQSVIWSCFNNHATATEDDLFKTQSHEIVNAYLQLRSFHAGQYPLNTTFYETTPSLDDLRLAMYNTVIEYLQTSSPKYKNEHLELPDPGDLTGMQRIRFLMNQYLTLTTKGSIERFKLAHEINLIKRSLHLPGESYCQKLCMVIN